MTNKIPYTPSWQNRFFDAVDRMPFPNIVVYVLLWLAIAFLNHLIPWVEGKLPWGEVEWTQFNFYVWQLVSFLGLDYFLGYSKQVLAKFRPALNINDGEYDQLSFRFVNISSSIGWAITLWAALFTAGLITVGQLQAYYSPNMLSGFSGIFIFVITIVNYSFGFAFFVFLMRQMILVGQFYARVNHINLFNLDPLNAFSGLTSRVGFILMIGITLNYVTGVVLRPENPQFGFFLFIVSLGLVIAVAAFIWPLLGIHQRLVVEKERVTAQNNLRLTKAYNGLERRIDKGQLKGLGEFQTAITALTNYRQDLKKISTWPWETGTLRNFVAALLVPMTAWVVQQILLRMVAR